MFLGSQLLSATLLLLLQFSLDTHCQRSRLEPQQWSETRALDVDMPRTVNVITHDEA